MTFSTPKSVSIVWAVADRDLREAIAAAHDAAVAQALRHIESIFRSPAVATPARNANSPT
ncbi:relaxase domain-containing protein [Acidithiobacillus ferriphilus]|nr:relaxase domain-containing protein [Acidithiobacillus ferriphilus]